MGVPVTLSRSDWDAVAGEFSRFFAGIGEVSVSADVLRFDAERHGVQTGFELNRDGTSAAFMPLHAMRSRWEEVTFDSDAAEISVWAEGISYTYRVPPRMLPNETR